MSAQDQFSRDRKPTSPDQYWAKESEDGKPFVATVYGEPAASDIAGLFVSLATGNYHIASLDWLWGDRVEYKEAPAVQQGELCPHCKSAAPAQDKSKGFPSARDLWDMDHGDLCSSKPGTTQQGELKRYTVGLKQTVTQWVLPGVYAGDGEFTESIDAKLEVYLCKDVDARDAARGAAPAVLTEEERESARAELEFCLAKSNEFGHEPDSTCEWRLKKSTLLFAVEALRATPSAQGLRPEVREIVAFLCGEAPLEGVWFGDNHPQHKGKFWWRSRLRAALSATKGEAHGNL